MPINIQRILPVLEEMELFSGFSQEEIVQIAGRFSDRTLQPNEVLVRKPDVEGNFYIVIEGSVVVRHAGESDSAQRIIIN
jgi:CRP-like cAMP-binding protein